MRSNNEESKYISEEEKIKQLEFINEIKIQNSNQFKKYTITTFGCQMNEHDSEKLEGILNSMGYTYTDSINNSDLIIYNTCCVRENAELKVYGHLGALKSLKKENPDIVVAVCGCMMQQEEVVDHIKSTYRHVDLIFGTHNTYKFPELLNTVLNTRKRIIDVWDSAGNIAEEMPILRKDGFKAWVNIIYGCNNFCSYCIVPYVRGRERSRDIEDIANEVKSLGKEGYKEITLLGQNVNSYGKDIGLEEGFAKLLKELNSIDEIERIRFLTSHPKDLSDEVIYAIRDLDKVCEYLHLPFQAGSSKVLKEMNRVYTKEEYLALVDKIKKSVPNISLSTDIIVGFPGETEEDFKDTLDVVEKVRFDTAYTFLYSKRTGTPAAKREEQIPEDTKKERFNRLLDLQNNISREINDNLLGQEVEILVEGLSKNSNEMYTGRTRTNKIVNFKGNEDLVGKLVKVKIDKVLTWSLEGSII